MAGTGPKQVSNQRVSVEKISTGIAALHVVQLDSTGGIITGGAGGGSTQVSVRDVLTSSGASVMDSTNNAIGVTIRAGSAAGTEYTDGDVDATVSGQAIVFDNSSNTLRPVTLTRGLPVNIVAGAAATSTIVTVSTGSLRVHQSTAADLNVTVAGYVAPSTTVAVSTGSVRVHQSTATDLLARVNQGVGNSSAADRWLVNTANSSAADFHGVRLVDSSGTGFHGPTNPVPIAVTDSSNAVVKPGDSANNALRVNVVAGAAGGSTIVTVSTGSVRVHQSSAADLNVTVANLSTTHNVSSLAGVVAVAPASSGATGFFAVRLSDGSTFVTDSTLRAIRVTSADVGGSTQVAVSSVGGAVIVRSSKADHLATVYQSTASDLLTEPRLSTANTNSSAYLPVRITDGTGFQALLSGFADGSTTSTLAAPGVAFNNGSNATMRLAGSSTPLPVHLRTSSGADINDSTLGALKVSVVQGGSTQVSIKEILTSSGASVMDSTNGAIKVNVVAGAAGGSTIVTISTVQGVVAVAPASSNATGFFAVRVSDGSTFLQPSIQYTDGSTVSTLVAGAIAFNNGTNATMRLAGSSTPFPVHIRTDSGASVMDSTNGAIKVNIVAGAGSGGTALADQTTFSTNVTNLTPVGGVVGGGDVPAGEAGAFRMSSVRALWVNPVDSTGGDITDSTQRAIRVNVVAGSAAGSTEVTVRQSTYTDFNTLSRVADRDASTQVAAVINTDPPSTTYGLAVRQVGAVAASTTVNVSSLAGAVIMRSSAANALVSVYQSTAADLNVTVAGYSTTAQVSSLAGRVAIAGFHATDGITNVTDSTNTAIRVNVVAGAAGGSTEVTVRQSTYTDFNTLSRIADRDQSTQVAAVLNATPASSVWALAVRETAPSTGPFAVSSIAGPVTVRSSAANALVSVYQSTAADLNVTVAGYVAPSTTVQVSSLGGVVAVAPASSGATGFFAVRLSDGSTFVTDSTLRAIRVTSADVGGSTQVAVSSLAGNVTVSPLSSGATGFFAVRVSDGSTFLQPSIEYTDGSTQSTSVGAGIAYVNGSNATMRLVGTTQPLPVQIRTGTLTIDSTTASITSTASTAIYSLVSSVAATRHKVFAFHVTSTHTRPSTFIFMSSNGSDIYGVQFGSGSSGVTGNNMAVTPPAFLFATATANALNCRIEEQSSATSTTLARVSISYVSEA